MSEPYACALPYEDQVNLAFYRGADLPDSTTKLRGTGKAMRHVPITRLDQLADASLRELIVAAREERRRALRLPG